MKLFNKPKPVAPEPVAPEAVVTEPVFDLLAAEKAFLKLHPVLLTGSTLCVRKGDKFVPLTEDVAAKFLRSHLVSLDQMKFWRRDLADDLLAFVRAGL